MTQNQVRLAWGVYPQMLNMLELEGKLSPVQVGQSLYYRLGELREVLGEPTNPEALRDRRGRQNAYFHGYGSAHVA